VPKIVEENQEEQKKEEGKQPKQEDLKENKDVVKQ